MRKIALTGATGFIGSILLKHLVTQGFQIKALFRPRSISPPESTESIEWIAGDLANEDSLRALVCDTDIVLHCAGAVRGRTLEDFQEINSEGLKRLLRAAIDLNVPDFLLISSLAAREPSLSAYAASKRLGENVLYECDDKISWNILRPPAVYGFGDREMLPLLKLMKRGIVPIIGDKKGRFSLIYVDDLAEAVTCVICSKKPSTKQCFELHDGHPDGYTWQEVASLVQDLNGKAAHSILVPRALLQTFGHTNAFLARLFGYQPMLTPGKVNEIFHPDWTCDNSTITNAIGWRPKVEFQEGMQRLFS